MENILPPDILADDNGNNQEQISQIENDEGIPELWEERHVPETLRKKRKSSFKVGFDMHDFEDGL